MTVKRNAENIGMVVNTILRILCTSTAVNSDIRSHIFTPDDRLDSDDSLKTVSFVFLTQGRSK